MPVLTAPAPRDQVSTRDADRFELCGEACLASAFGIDVESVVTWLRQHEGGERAVHNGTGVQELIGFCTARGTVAAPHYVGGAMSRGHYCLVLVWSDHQGNPVSRQRSAGLHAGGIGHWLLGYGTSGPKVDVMQPRGGRLLAYDLGQGQDQQLGIEINHHVGARPSPAPAPKPSPKAPPPVRQTTGAKPRQPAATRVHVVRSGDRFSPIAWAHRVTLQRLIAANPQIKNPNPIAPGQRVMLPESKL
jgi:hypothetical protein